MSDTFDHAGDAFYDELEQHYESNDGFFPEHPKPVLNEDSHKLTGKFHKNTQNEWEGEGE